MPPQPRAVFRGTLWLLLLGFLIGATAWLFAGCVVPYLDGSEPDYLILLPSVSRLAALSVIGVVLLYLLHVKGGIAPEDLSPLLLLALPLLAVAMLATPMRHYAAPWLYVGIDLWWWLVAAIGLLLIARLRTSVDVLRSQRWFEVSLAAMLVTSSLVSSPPLRFQSVLVGDEPKYLRYLENWYRGHGMDVADLPPIAELPSGFRADVPGNFRRLGTAASRVAIDLVADGRRLVGLSAATPPGHARSEGGWFVEGKRGGIYQMHNPGISLLLLPGYIVDRALGRTHAWHPQFPTNVYGTGVTVLILYVLWGVAVFRLLSSYSGNALISWVLTIVVFLSLPTAAFAYQYYPEVAAGLAIAVLMRYGLLTKESRPLSAAAYGMLAGYLPWLHLRFLPLALAAAAVVVVTRWRHRSAVTGFIAGIAVPLLALGAYYYHVTGSFMPWAMYSLAPDATLFSAARAWRDLPAFWFDRTWGLIAHAPVYLFALPGLWLSWRKSKAIALAIAVAVLAIAIPAAGHGYTGAFTTPLRLVAAVIPLLALPLADATIAFAGSTWFRIAVILFGAISVQNGLTYNLHLVKSEAFLQGTTIGGWMFPLLLPDFNSANRLGQPLTILWILVTAALVAWPVLRRPSTPRASHPERAWSLTAATATVLVLFAAIGSAAGALDSARFNPAFMLKAGDARDRLIHFELTGHPSVRWSSEHGTVDVKTYFPNSEGTAIAHAIHPERPHVNNPVEVSVAIRRPGNRPGWGTAIVDFGDGSPPAHVAVEGSSGTAHTYQRSGEYLLRIDVEPWGLPRQTIAERVPVLEQ